MDMRIGVAAGLVDVEGGDHVAGGLRLAGRRIVLAVGKGFQVVEEAHDSDEESRPDRRGLVGAERGDARRFLCSDDAIPGASSILFFSGEKPLSGRAEPVEKTREFLRANPGSVLKTGQDRAASQPDSLTLPVAQCRVTRKIVQGAWDAVTNLEFYH